ncbi:MAG: hypothetical protein WCS27_11825 [Victivallaceae bacterium]|jgi:hypothetical protein
MKKVYRICKNNIYCIPVIIFVGSYEECEEYRKRRFKLQPKKQRFYAGYSDFLEDTKTGEFLGFIWMPRYTHTISNMGTLSHECLHIAMRILEVCNIQITFDNHEALAYLHGHIFEEALASILHSTSKTKA